MGGGGNALLWASGKEGRAGGKGRKGKRKGGKEGRKEAVVVYSDNVKMDGFPKASQKPH